MVIESSLYAWVILPLLIFCARICDVTLGTLRLIFITRGMKYIAAVVSFIEILIWVFAISQIIKNLNNIMCYFAYAGGFASGSFLGITIVNKLSLGKVLIRIITKNDINRLVNILRAQNYGVTCVDAEGAEGPVKIIFSIINRYNLKDVVGIVKEFNPQAFYSVEEVKVVSEGIFPERLPMQRLGNVAMFGPLRKGK